MQTLRGIGGGINQCGGWPAIDVRRPVAGDTIYTAAEPAGRAQAPYGDGRVWEVTHRVEVQSGGECGECAEGRAQLGIDVWTGDVLRVRYEIAVGHHRVQVQECFSFRSHTGALFKMALRVAREVRELPPERGALVSRVAESLERRCATTLRDFRCASRPVAGSA